MGNKVVANTDIKHTGDKDEKTGQVVTRVDMPEFPGLDKIMEAAEKFYGFVNTGTKK